MNLFRKVDHVIMKNIQRKVALEYFRENIDQASLAKKYGRAQSTISRWLKYGAYEILIDCDIKVTDSHETIAQKVSNSNGKYTESDIIAAIQYLKKHHVF